MRTGLFSNRSRRKAKNLARDNKMKNKFGQINNQPKFYIRNYVREWNLFERVWLIVFTTINIYLFFAWSDTWMGLTASLSGMLCVVLTAKGKISSFYVGIVNILAYSYVAYRSAYYGDVALNMLYFLPMSFLGIYFWGKNSKKNKARGKEVLVRSFTWKQKLTWFISSLAILFIFGLVLRAINGTLPFVDSATTVFSVMATILLTKRVTDQWFYWIMVDVLSIVMWIYIFVTKGSDISILVMWTAFLVNAIYGYYNWRKLEKNQNEER